MINHSNKFFSSNIKKVILARRLLYALLGAIIQTVICYSFWMNGTFRVSGIEFIIIFSGFWIGNIAYFIVFRTGLNKRFKDPSLTVPLMIWAVTWVMYTIFLTNDLRTILLMFYFFILVFGAFSLNWRSYIIVNTYGLFLYVSIIFYFYQYIPEIIRLERELIIFLSFVAITFLFSIVSLEGGNTRKHLKYKNKKLIEAFRYIKYISMTDELTKIKNRRYIIDILEKQKLMVERGRHNFSICMIDIDRFKNVNDIYGHKVGDDVLKQLCKTIEKNLRRIDYFARYGGEEFLLVLPLTTKIQAEQNADRLRTIIEIEEFNNIIENKITISMGVTEYLWPEEIETMLARVDAALYAAKRNGRNQVVAN